MAEYNIIMFANKQDYKGQVQKILMSIDIGKTYSMLDLLSSSIKFAEVSRFCNIKISSVNGYPVIVYTSSNDTPNNYYEKKTYEYDVTVFEDKLDTENTEQVNTIKKLLEKQYQTYFPKATLENVNTCIDIIVSQIKPYFSGKLAIQVEYKNPFLDVNGFAEIKDAINKMNVSSSITSKYISPAENSISFQKSPEDRFFIPLPEYEIFKGETLITQQLIPDLREIWIPFAHIAYYSPHWKRIIGKSAEYRRRYLSNIDKVKDIKVSEKDLTQWVDYPEEYIKGNSENDDLPIMENEIEYFNALLKFIEFDLSQNYSAEVAAKLFAEGGLTQEMEQYFEELLEKVLLLNWSCSGMFRINRFSIDMSDGEDEDNDGKATTEDGGAIAEFHYYMDTNPQGFDGIDMIKNYIKKVATGDGDIKPGGCKTYVEAIVKLSRWGDRRPANLKLNGTDNIFSLTRFSICNPTVNFNKLTTKMINGRPLSLSGYLILHWSLTDKDYCKETSCSGLISAPVGFITIKEFESDTNLSQIVYISFFDVIYEYLSGNQFINGIDLKEDGTFVVNNELCNKFSEPLISAINNTINSNACALYTSQYLEEVAKETKMQATSLSDLSCLAKASISVGGVFSKWFTGLPIKDKEHLIQMLDNGAMSLFNLMHMSVLKYILPIYMQYSDSYKPLADTAILHSGELDFSAALNLFYEVSEKNSVSNVVGFYTTKNKIDIVSEKNKENTSDIAVNKLESFGAYDSSLDKDLIEEDKNLKQEIINKEEDIPYVMPRYKISGKLFPLMYVSGNSKFQIGYADVISCEKNGQKRAKIVLFSLDEKPDNSEISSAELSANKLLVHFMKITDNLINGIYNAEESSMVFASSTSVAKIATKLIELTRK